MYEPKLFTSQREIIEIKANMAKYKWYSNSFSNIKKQADTFINNRFSVPKESGYVFYDTCSRDNTSLIFDPLKPYDHICPTCGMNYKDKPFNRAWITKYHAYLSQMSIYIGISYQILKDETYALVIKNILLDYVKYYNSYPNYDNELGPTKVFQSTYMESVWVMHLACAYDMVKESSCFSLRDKQNIETNLFKQSANIIVDYDEGVNNRQAFNNGGLLAIGYILEDSKLIDYALNGKNGFINHMKYSVLDDGFWYEGDNYHFATLPSIVSIAEMSRHNGLDLYNREFNGHSIEMMYSAPLKSLQPDLTFPSRKDSGYASHIAQQWYAGLYELAYSRFNNIEFSAILNTMYAYKDNKDTKPHNAAGIMDVFVSSISNRNHLDWRGFLNASPNLHDSKKNSYYKSINMKGTGLAILRSESEDYVSLDYGKYGGGHGHPDRLNLTFLTKNRRWLCDYGTCNYYFDQLRWYRASIAHNTITIDGQDHLIKDGTCSIFKETKDFSLVKSKVHDIAPGVNFKRTEILFKGGILFDFFEVTSEDKHVYHYALHSFGTLSFKDLQLENTKLPYENYDYIKDLKRRVTSNSIVSTFKHNNDYLTIYTIGDTNTYVYSGMTYGPPNKIPQLFPMMILERNIDETNFVSLMETNEGDKVASFEKSNELEYTIVTNNNSKYIISFKHNTIKVSIYKENNYKEIYELCEVPEQDIIKPAFNIEEWIQVNKLGMFSILLKSNRDTKIELLITLNNKKIVLKPFEEKIINIPLSKLLKYIKNEKIDIRYSIIFEGKEFERIYKKAYTKIVDIKYVDFVNLVKFTPNLTIDSIKNVRRAEKIWGGINDISAKATIYNTGDDLYINIKVKDSCVLFSGGKFPYDNDSVQVYLDRRDNKYRKVDRITKGVYGLLVVPGINDNSSTVRAIKNTIRNIEKIGVSTMIVSDGYEMNIMIPWVCIGGRAVVDSVLGFDIIVNDRDIGVRRDIQMVWSQCKENERIYLREDLHNPSRFGLLQI